MADGVNIVLCIIVAIAFLLIVAVNIYIVVHFQNEEDKNTAIFPKVVVVTTFTFICVSVLMMPMDVANQRTKRPDQAGIPMDILWQIVFISMAVLAFIVPFAFFYYEAEDPDSSSNAKQIKEGLKWNIVWLVAFFVPTLILWFTIGFAEIPIIKYTSPLRQFDGQPFPVLTNLDVLRDQLIVYRVSFILYLISMITFCGTFVLVFFGGVGFAALPMDLINSFRTRPKQMSVVQYAEKKIIIGKRAASLLERGRALKQRFNNAGRTRPRGRREVREFNRFRTGVFMVEQEYKVLERSYNRGGAPMILYIIWDYVQLLLGIIGVGLSITWLLHIILFMAPRTKYFSLFLNKMFIDMDNAFGLFGTGAYAVWSFSPLVRYQGKFQGRSSSSPILHDSPHEGWRDVDECFLIQCLRASFGCFRNYQVLRHCFFRLRKIHRNRHFIQRWSQQSSIHQVLLVVLLLRHDWSCRHRSRLSSYSSIGQESGCSR